MMAVTGCSGPARAPIVLDGGKLLDATASILGRAALAMFSLCPVVGDEEPWRAIVNRIDAAEESCRRRLPIAGADYIDDFAAELRELIILVPRAVRTSLYAALAMLPALRLSMRETPDTLTEKSTT